MWEKTGPVNQTPAEWGCDPGYNSLTWPLSLTTLSVMNAKITVIQAAIFSDPVWPQYQLPTMQTPMGNWAWFSMNKRKLIHKLTNEIIILSNQFNQWLHTSLYSRWYQIKLISTPINSYKIFLICLNFCYIATLPWIWDHPFWHVIASYH